MPETYTQVARMTDDRLTDASAFIARSLKAMSLCGQSEEEILSRCLNEPVTREVMRQRLDAVTDPEDLDRVMRMLRREVMVSEAGRDMTGRADFFEVVSTMTALAEETISACVRVHSKKLAERFGVPVSSEGVVQDLMVVGMGKLGGEELNASSDIDLVFVYDEGGDTQPLGEYKNARRQISNHEFFDKLARRVIASLNDLDGIGFVFRVDMRLRPFGDAGPLVVSSAMLEEYLYSEGRDWERFAWLKGRVVNRAVLGNDADFAQHVEGLRQLVRPFVFRKYVDFSAISALARLHEMIRAETVRREAGKDRGINVKLGSGGIREIEFITQTFQIIRAGREPALRGKSTLPMLQELAKQGLLTVETVEKLSNDYIFLRNVEHALQYVDDKQTQMLANDPAVVANIAAMLGMTPEGLTTHLAQVRTFVSGTFDGIFHTEAPKEEDERWPAGWRTGAENLVDDLAETLKAFGIEAAQELAGRILKMMRSRLLSARSQEPRDQLARFVMRVVQKAGDWAKLKTSSVSADVVLERYLQLLEVVIGRPTYVALLNQYPEAAERVGKMLAISRWAGDYLAQHPLVLDELVDLRAVRIDDYTPVDTTAWVQQVTARIESAGDDRERQLNILRDAHHSAMFHLLLADLEGRLSVERLADQLSALADAVLTVVMRLAWEAIATRHCETPKFAVIGYGKLGGKELGYASDLDLIFLYEDDAPEAEMNYVKLVRRMISWLTMQTSSGILFDIDMRLRPNGENGLSVSSIEMFKRYQRNEDGNGAWFWEHQALTRARFCAGDPTVGEAFEAERKHILMLPRERSQVARDVIEMRQKMLDGHPNSTELFDVKHDRGGMVDVEFIVQMLVLTFSHAHPELTNNFGNTLLTEMAARLGLIPEDLAEKVVNAYRHYRNIQREIRLSRGEDARSRVPLEDVKQDRDAVLQLWNLVFQTDEPQPKKA
ncbi:MAG: bifunctional [glutamate--ammonia ligase]-adenylyl-L-tyrosine phosphorylase/[glutamate--ammonia-ligase] adenylyltransferase [Sutterellaceae bacterium]|nr:bifunctional [glutamate--ammonia ligase]-adenylyl-L-tyrosine phosphorylase/[glutamate--ammonia-ligase] adenylyltransferase [Sutterellaceae bacterium]